MSGPGAASIALLAKPTWNRALAGALRTALYLTATAPVLFGIWVAKDQQSSTAILILVIAIVISLFCTGVVTSLLAVTWGVVTGYLLGRLLARTATWQLHLVAYLLLGALTGGLVAWLFAAITQPSLPLGIGLAVLTALCVAGGWAATWRHAILIERERQHDELAALREGGSAILAE